MTTANLWHWTVWAWYCAAAYFALSALKIKRAKIKEPLASRLQQSFFLVLGYWLLFWLKLPLGFLSEPFVASYLWIAQVGFVLACAGCALTIWARASLGQYWSGRITLKEDHKLIESGPYARIRHPLYTGILTAMLGTALVGNQWRCLLGFLVTLVGFTIKARREEALLTSEFGEQYVLYRRRSGFLLPKFGK